ncbi:MULTISPECIES: hypothetical protein [Pseudidiomarina]|uniref:hypothetical protein n=1 Tax=Pseudidiomarina TaxID=2800384 RepID=UPI0030EBCADA|tara:strand:- start:1656 stop:1928 length:273 start_codon:yes stop_codon:yes gene_type:complete
MKTTIATVILLSSVFAGSAFANESQPRDVLESSLQRSIQQEVEVTRSQVKAENQLELVQYFAEFKFALNPSRVASTVAEAAADYLVGNEE